MFADDLLLVARDRAELKRVYDEMIQACAEWSLAIQESKLQWRGTHSETTVRIMAFFGLSARIATPP